ncbi:MAG TPA: hypothetical protein VGU66_20045 [Candidatus Elarobacter sp.]|nr:hypothetical protein [Candidatus Elarobacter sp.]
MKTFASLALVALLAGCSGGGGSTAPSSPAAPGAPAAIGRAPHNGGPGTTSITYYDSYAPTGQCNPGVLTVNNSYAPAHNLSFPAGQGPPLVLSNCHFATSQYVMVTLGTPAYGSPFIRQTDYTVTVDAPDKAQVTGTWTACGATLPCTPGLTGTVNFTIGPPDSGGGL